MRTLPHKLAIFCLCLLHSPTPYAAEFYRWVDADGVLHFDTTKPAHVETTTQRVDPEKTRPNTQNFSAGCQTQKCQRNLQKLLGKQLLDTPKLTPHTNRTEKIRPEFPVTKLSPKTQKDKAQSTLERFLQRQNNAQSTTETNNTATAITPAKANKHTLKIPPNFTLIKPNKKNQQSVREQYGTAYDDSKKQKSDAVLRRLIREKPTYY